MISNKIFNLADNIRDLKTMIEARPYPVKVIEKEKYIFKAGMDADSLYMVRSGKVKLIKNGQYHKNVILKVMMPKDLLGYKEIMTHIKFDTSAVAMEKVQLYKIPAKDFRYWVKYNSGLTNEFLKIINDEISELENKLLDFSYGPIKSRVAKVILDLAEQGNPGHDTLKIRYSRNDLAQMVGTTRETLIRQLAELKKSDAIKITGRTIEVLDRKKLQNTY